MEYWLVGGPVDGEVVHAPPGRTEIVLSPPAPIDELIPSLRYRVGGCVHYRGPITEHRCAFYAPDPTR